MKAVIQLRKDSNGKDGAWPLVVSVHIGRRKVSFALGVSCRPADFTKERRVRRGAPGSTEINLVLDKALARANEIFVCARLAGTAVTAESFRAEWHTTGGSLCLLQYATEELARQERLGLVGIEAAKQYRSCIKRLRRFWPQGLPISRLTKPMLEELDGWLRGVVAKRARSRNNGMSARAKAFKTLHKFWNHAVKAGLYRGPSPWQGFKPPKTPHSIIWLTRAEVASLEGLLRSGRFRDCLRPFLFSCYTGLRVGDMQGLDAAHLVDGRILKTMDKGKGRTPKTLVVPIGSNALRVLEDGGLPLVSRSTVVLNRELKEAARAAGISKRISFHTGRHTFATLSVEAGVPIEVLKELLGHSSITHTMIYAHVAGERKVDAIALLDRSLGAHEK